MPHAHLCLLAVFWSSDTRLLCAAEGLGVGLRGVLGHRRRREARPEDLRGGAGGGGGRGAGGGAAHRRQPAQGLRPRAEPRDARAAAGPVRDRRGGELAAGRRAGAPGPRRRAGVARRGCHQGGSGACNGQVKMKCPEGKESILEIEMLSPDNYCNSCCYDGVEDAASPRENGWLNERVLIADVISFNPEANGQ